ncbi:MAG: hypothetical protein QNM02_06885 [Acidimicrobiia bacterium]|nr:hypothetical protein [Acidimicrobiia bacterium]
MTTTADMPELTATQAPPVAHDRDGARVRAVHRAARPLRAVLRANAVFSATCGVVALLAADRLAEWIGADVVWAVRLVGVGLVAYSPLLLAIAASRPARLTTLSVLVSIADFGWVAATVALLASGAVETTGTWIMAGTAAVVFVFGVQQLITRRALTRTLARTTG